MIILNKWLMKYQEAIKIMKINFKSNNNTKCLKILFINKIQCNLFLISENIDPSQMKYLKPTKASNLHRIDHNCI